MQNIHSFTKPIFTPKPTKQEKNCVKKHPNFFSEPSLIWIEGFFFPLYSNPEFSKEEPLWSIQRNQQIKTISSADGSTVLAQKSLPSCQEIGLHSLLSYYSLNMNLLSQWTEHLFMKGYGQEKHVFIGMNVSIRPGATLNPPFIIGDNTHIENTAQIESGSIIGDSCIIDQETQIRDSIVFGRTYISPSLFLKKKIITFYRLIDPFSGVKIDFSTKIFASQIHNNPLQRYFYKTIAGIVASLILIPLGPLYLFFKKIGIKPQSYITYQTTDGIDSLYKLPIYTKQFSTKGKWFFRFSLDKVPLLCQTLQGKLSLVGDTIWDRETHLDLTNRYKDYSPGVFNYSESIRPPDFVEKILIMEDGLNDVVIEAVKRDICASVVKSSPDFVFLQFEPSGEEGPSVLFQNLGDRQIVRIPLRPEAAELMTVIPDEPPRFLTVDREFLKENE